MPKIQVILGSVRAGRAGERVAKWAARRLAAHPQITFELLDLKDYPLPFYDEPESPNVLAAYSNEVATRWAAKVGEADGYLIITPEYNHGYPAVLKNALDYVYKEWVDKPVSFVSYSSGLGAGIRSVEQLRQVVLHLGMIPMTQSVAIGRVQDALSEEGVPSSEALDGLLDKQVEQLVEWVGRLQAHS